VADALAKLLGEDDRLVLRIVGFLDLPMPLMRYWHRIEFFPLQDFQNLQRLVGEVELNLVPLQNNGFTNCKSELKYFEAAVVGTCTIASPTFAFREAICDGANGWLANAHQWAERIAQVLAARDDDYAAVAERAAASARAVYAPSVMADSVRAVTCRGFVAAPTRSEAGAGCATRTAKHWSGYADRLFRSSRSS
jgi:glycosyltransferase involved in cell wall biosynthesis